MFTLLTPADRCLLQAARQGLALTDEPFAELGRGLGLSGEAVASRLRALAGSGLIDGLRLLPDPYGGAVGPAANTTADHSASTSPTESQLLDALASGLPLVQRPYEALGAMLGQPAAAVCSCLAQWLQRAPGRCIAPTIGGQPVPP